MTIFFDIFQKKIDDSELLHGLERLRDIFHGKIEHSWLCREPTVWKWGHMTLTYWPFKATKFDWNVRIWRLVNEILGQSNLLWSSWQLLFWCHLFSHTTQTETMELEVHRVHWQPTTPPGFSMVNKVNLLLWDLVLLWGDYNIHGTKFFFEITEYNWFVLQTKKHLSNISLYWHILGEKYLW